MALSRRIAGALFLALAGCVVPPTYHAPAPPPPEDPCAGDRMVTLVFDKEGELPPPREVKKGDQPPPAPTGALTFDQVIHACLNADPKIRAGLEEIEQAHADFITSSLKPNPEFYTDVQMLPIRRFTPEKTGGPPQFDAQVAYPIDWYLFGKRAAAMLAADKGVRVSEAEFADLIRTRVTDAAVSFYDVLEAKSLVEVAKQDLENFTRAEASIKKAVEAGGRSQVELNRIRLDALKSGQALREAEAALEKAKAKLRALLGAKDADPAFDVAGSLDVAESGEPFTSDHGFHIAVENRPDIKALQLKVDRAQAAVEVEDRKARPEVKPMVGYTHQFQRQAIGQPDADSYTLAVTSTIPWHDKNQGNRLKARSALAQSHAELQLGLVDLRAEVDQSLTEYRLTSRNARAVAGEQLRLAREVRESITTAYNAGGRNLLDFLDAQRNFRETYKLYITSRAGFWRSVVKLNAAIGKQELRHVPPPADEAKHP